MRKNRLAVFIPALIIALFMNFVPVFAAGGEQSSSPGTPGQKPLNLSSIVLEDGSSIDVPSGIITTPKFKITFDKNVVNMLYWENNVKCFSIVSQSKNVVPVNVTKIDDTVDFSQRQNIFVEPSVKLNPGTSYTIAISPDLTAKNGIKLGQSAPSGITVNFKTAGEAQSNSVVAAPSSKAASNIANIAAKNSAANNTSTSAGTSGNSSKINSSKTASSSLASNSANTAKDSVQAGTDNITAAAAVNTAVPDEVNAQTKQSSKKVESNINIMDSIWIIVLVLILACWAIVEFIIKKKKGIGKR